jgi:hypothetical protein
MQGIEVKNLLHVQRTLNVIIENGRSQFIKDAKSGHCNGNLGV